MIRILFVAIALSLFTERSYAQEQFTLNQGGTNQKEYFTEVSYESVRGKLIVKATIKGKEYRFILDTGAPNMITKVLFDELKPKVLRKVPVGDGNGKVDSLTIVSLNEITLGNVVFNDIPTLVAKDPLILDCHKVDGFIGSNMLRNSTISFLSKEHKIILTDQPEKLKLKKKQSSDLFLTPSQSSPFFKTKVRGKNSGVVQLLFDTGMEGLYSLALKHYTVFEKENIFSLVAKSKGSNTIGIHGMENDAVQYRLRIPELDINGAILKNVSVQSTASDNSRMGSDLLQYGSVTLDYKNKKFYFEPFEAVVDLYAGSFPVSIIPKDNKAFIGIIWDEKLKDKINVNDQVLAIDEVDYSHLALCDLIVKTKIFEGKTEATLTVQNASGVVSKVTINKQ
ncbi:retropepsin-like aspartic protease [Pedobacter sp. ASV28]|uniref:retropepsin-like aspartic protease n=1 Tax=Pedobacter sp. ASV28 TaxID=2795123 RepID=UPI0018EC2797|nr:retropepsin-like aspartic protease [Pedobacter sp. ASV28]